jgi:uncharacterized protein YegJ (DUF2314 family)
MNYLRIIIIIIFVIAGIFGAGSRRNRRSNANQNDVVTRPGQPDMIRVSEKDPEMEKAIATAPQTVQQFITALKSPKPSQTGFSIKKGFVDRGMTEHMWLTDVTFDGTNFHGTLNNDPVDVKNVKMGQAVVVLPKDISDWMYLDDSKLIGGYTVRVLYNRETPAGKKQFLEETGFKIE